MGFQGAFLNSVFRLFGNAGNPRGVLNILSDMFRYGGVKMLEIEGWS